MTDFYRFFLLILLCLSAFTATGCHQVIAVLPFPPDASSEMDSDTLIAILTSETGNVELAGEVSQPFFPMNGQLIQVFGEPVQVFEFPDADAAEQAAELVSADGFTIGTMQVDWVSNPHFYYRDRLIVLYLGDNYDLAQVLERILGPQFAGSIAFPDI